MLKKVRPAFFGWWLPHYRRSAELQPERERVEWIEKAKRKKFEALTLR
jgi:hypothetical protein